MKKWTNEQLQAIESRDDNLLVSAAAGSGKTALLIERIFRIVKEGTGIDQVLVLTFTKGAAGEMKNRLNQAFSKALESAQGQARKDLLVQMGLVGHASISTFHSFCLNLLRVYFHQVAIDPGFTIGNEIEMTLMRKEALEEVFESFYERAEDPFLRLVDQYAGNKDDQALKDLVEEFYFFLSAQPYAKAYCDRALAYFDFDLDHFEESHWGKKLKEIIFFQLQAAGDYVQKAMDLSNDQAFEKAYQLTKEEYESIQALLAGLDKKPLLTSLQAINALVFKRFTGNKKADEDRNERIKAYRNQAKKQIEGIKTAYGSHFYQKLLDLKATKPSIAALIAVTRQLDQVFSQKKRDKNILDYNDLEQLSLKLLEDADIASEIKARYAYIFIDEYQDTNEMQETILQKIVRPDNFFMVGDVKQSIYRFRLADPGIFMAKYDQYDRGEKGRRIDLNKNFRSSKAVIDSVNALFSKIMSLKLGEITYDQGVCLNSGLAKEKKAEKTAIHLLYQETEEDLSRAELEATFIAKKIISLVGIPLYRSREGLTKAIAFRDFGVLLRSVAKNGEIYLKIFRDFGIPTHFEGESRYYESLEITTMINLLKVLDNDHQDIPLLSLMVSPIGHFTAAECNAIRINHPDGYFYQAVEAYGEDKDDDLSDKVRAFYQTLEGWQGASKRLAVDEFLWLIYMESDYYEFVGALPGGLQRQNNLKILLKRAADYKRSTLRGLYQFVRFIENMKKYKQDVSPSQSISDQDNVVRLMTIHKSKGLEFPIVFIGGLSQGFNKRDNHKPILFHKELGICPDYVDAKKRYKRTSLAKEICKDQNSLELLSEEMRLLYVAMTRAEENLHLVAGLKEENSRHWREDPQAHHLMTSSSFLDWIMTALVKEEDLAQAEIDFEHFILHQYDGQALESLKKSAVVDQEPELKKDPAITKRVDDQLSFDYQGKSGQVLPGKMSVTEVGRLLRGGQAPLKLVLEKPLFLQNIEKTFSPAQKGSALHMLLENLDLKVLKGAYGEKSPADFKIFLKGFLAAEKTRLMADDYLPKELGQTIDLTKIEAFYLAPLGKRILESLKVKREWAFTYRLEPDKIRRQWGQIKESVLVQGIIDCAFLEDDKWVVVDYKTDFFKDDRDRQSRIEGYRPQIDLYAQAISGLSAYPVKEKIIAFIAMGETISLDD